MTQILNNMKRKEKKGLFYLIGIAIMVAIMGISCSESPTAPANFSETDTTIQPEDKPSNPEQKPEDKPSVPEQPVEPAMKVKGNYGVGQFDGLVFEDSTLRAEVKTIYHDSPESIIVLSDGREYGCGVNAVRGEDGKSVAQISYRLTPRDHSYSYSGTATFRNDGYLHLSIGGKNHTLKWVK